MKDTNQCKTSKSQTFCVNDTDKQQYVTEKTPVYQALGFQSKNKVTLFSLVIKVKENKVILFFKALWELKEIRLMSIDLSI